MYDSRERLGAEYLISWLLNNSRKEVSWGLVQKFGELVQDVADRSGVDIKVLYSDIQIRALLDNYSDYFVSTETGNIAYNKNMLRYPNYEGELSFEVYRVFLEAYVNLGFEG